MNESSSLSATSFNRFPLTSKKRFNSSLPFSISITYTFSMPLRSSISTSSRFQPSY
ncbi:hypothetical protein EVA_16887 [gut metagenome]|uniref:Uncharacterized protein n=1 Tax=gut metagenome TaxID=749906 RepID=J9C5A3_9ZZZZ